MTETASYVTSPPVLYILMRNDIPDLNPGKAVAQGSHAAHQFLHDFWDRWSESFEIENANPLFESQCSLIDQWQDQTDSGFGTCIVLTASGPEIEDVMKTAEEAGLHHGVVHDPTYPVGSLAKSTDLTSLFASLVGFAMAIVSFSTLAVSLPARSDPRIYLCAFLMSFVAPVFLLDFLRGRKKTITGAPYSIPLDTCAYLFGRHDQAKLFVAHLDLMP